MCRCHPAQSRPERFRADRPISAPGPGPRTGTLATTCRQAGREASHASDCSTRSQATAPSRTSRGCRPRTSHDRRRGSCQGRRLIEDESDRGAQPGRHLGRRRGRPAAGEVRTGRGDRPAVERGKPAGGEAARHPYRHRPVRRAHAGGERGLRIEDEGQGTGPEPGRQPAPQRRQRARSRLDLGEAGCDEGDAGPGRTGLQPAEAPDRGRPGRVDAETVQRIGGIGHDAAVVQHVSRLPNGWIGGGLVQADQTRARDAGSRSGRADCHRRPRCRIMDRLRIIVPAKSRAPKRPSRPRVPLPRQRGGPHPDKTRQLFRDRKHKGRSETTG